MTDTAFYQNMANVALRLITSKGRDDLVLKRTTSGNYNPDEDTEETVTIEQPVKCIVLPASASPADSTIEGTVTAAGLRNMKVAAADLEWKPEPGDYTDFEGSRWKCLGVTPTSPAGITLVYDLLMQRA